MEMVTCIQCGAESERRTEDQKYCDKVCRRRFNGRGNSIKCMGCDIHFQSKGPQDLFCKRSCRVEHKRKKQMAYAERKIARKDEPVDPRKARMCTGKRRFNSKLDANIILMKLSVSDKDKRREKRSYPCPYCKKWHLTSRG